MTYIVSGGESQILIKQKFYYERKYNRISATMFGGIYVMYYGWSDYFESDIMKHQTDMILIDVGINALGRDLKVPFFPIH